LFDAMHHRVTSPPAPQNDATRRARRALIAFGFSPSIDFSEHSGLPGVVGRPVESWNAASMLA
jgi:hypothetical protein